MDLARLAAMLNQIARNLAPAGQALAAEQTAEHVRRFWDPRMRQAILSGDPPGLSEVAAAALALLKATPQDR